MIEIPDKCHFKGNFYGYLTVESVKDPGLPACRLGDLNAKVSTYHDIIPGIVVFCKLQNNAFGRIQNVVPCKILLSDFDT